MTAQTCRSRDHAGNRGCPSPRFVAAALRAVAIANQLPLRDQVLAVAYSGQPTLELVSRPACRSASSSPLARAAFQVPCGYRFRIEHISLSLPP